MKGLILKDYLIMQRSSKKITKLLSLALYTILLVCMPNIYIFALIVTLAIPLECSGTATTLRDQDEKVNSNQFILSLPFQKKEIVISRYLFMFLYVLQQMAISFLITIIFYNLFHVATFSYHLILWAIGFAMALFFGSINLLSSYILNLNGVVFMYLISIILSFIIFLVPVIFNIDVGNILTHISYLWIIIPCFLVVCILGSVYASIHLFERSHS